MTYKITHKSQTECRIRYIESEPVERSWLNQWHALGIIVIAMIFVPNVSNIYLQLIVYYCLLVIASWLIHFIYRSLLIPALEFEIGLNRIDNRITVTNLLKANKPLQIHPLMNFTGFEYREIPSSHRLENHTPAELYLIFMARAHSKNPSCDDGRKCKNNHRSRK